MKRSTVLSLVPAVVFVMCVSLPCAAQAVLPDLDMPGVSADPTPGVGTSIGVRGHLHNAGEVAVSPNSYSIGLFFDRGSPPAVGDAPDLVVLGPYLVSSAVPWVEYQSCAFEGVTSSTPGTWAMYVVLDCFDDLPEADETNNVGGPLTVTWTPLAPDLVVTDVVVSDASPLKDGYISIDVTIQNQGAREASSCSASLAWDGSAAPSVGDGGVHTLTGPSLGVGQDVTLSFTDITQPLGPHHVYAIANDSQTVGESDLTNNVAGPEQVVWHTAGPNPDLVVLDVQPSIEDVTCDDTIDVDIHIFNAGTVDAGAFTVEFFYDETAQPVVGTTGDETFNLTGLASGATTVLTVAGLSVSGPDDWWTATIVDNDLQITENNEGDDNVYMSGIWWRDLMPDVRVVSVVPSDCEPPAGDAVTVAVTVENQGELAAGAFEVALFYDETAYPGASDAGDQTLVVAGLAAGAQTTVTFTGLESATVDRWSLYATVDGSQVIAESVENNNVSALPVIVWWKEYPPDDTSTVLPDCTGGGRPMRGGPACAACVVAALVLFGRRRITRAMSHR